MSFRRHSTCLLLAAVMFTGRPCGARAQSFVATLELPDPRSTAERLLYFIDERRALEQRRDEEVNSANGDPARIAQAHANLNDRLDGIPDVLPLHLWSLIYYALPPRVVSEQFKAFLRDAVRQRVDEQIGGSPTAGASTSTVARTGLATLFGFAVESGAVTQTIDQNVGTLRANADGLMRFLTNQEVLPACAKGAAGCSAPTAWKNLELSASFAMSEAGTQRLGGATNSGAHAAFTANVNQRQLTSAGARYAVLNNRDLRSDAYRAKWSEWFLKNRASLEAIGLQLLATIQPVANTIRTVNAAGGPAGPTDVNQYSQWLVDTKTLLKGRSGPDWERTLQQQLDILLGKLRALDPDFDRKLQDAGDAYARYFSLSRSLGSTLVTDPALTLEYQYSQPALQPTLHHVKVAWARSPQPIDGTANPGTVTLNAALEWYAELQPIGPAGSMRRWKDLQASIQFDRPLGPPASPAVLSLGGYVQYQLNPGAITIPEGATTLPGTTILLPAAGSTLLTEKGTIAAVQAVLTIRLPGSGLKMPIGVSWSNRTELVTGSQVRGHIGFTFDTAPLLLLSSVR